jgi:hypothetical protein
MSTVPTFRNSSLDSIGRLIQRQNQKLERLRNEESTLRARLVSALRRLAYEAGQVGFRTETRQLDDDPTLERRIDEAREAKAALDAKLQSIARTEQFIAALRSEYDDRFARQAFGPRIQVSAGR